LLHVHLTGDATALEAAERRGVRVEIVADWKASHDPGEGVEGEK